VRIVAKRRKVNNLLALAILSMLATGRPMHPYEIAMLLRRTGKERDMNVKWGSFYTVVQNLEKHGFIEATGSDRDGRRPERTVYTITPVGRDELQDWVRELVAVPQAEFPPFVAALSVLGVLPPDEVEHLLQARVTALESAIQTQQSLLASATPHVPRVFLIEDEYAVAMLEAEAAWVRSLLAELADDTMPGLAQWRKYHETGEMDPQYLAMLFEGGQPTQT
jgi:DNA-binding PadR family transcriptional regulator